MDFEVPARVEGLLGQVREFVRGELEPLELAMIQRGFLHVKPRLEALRGEVKQRGWWLPHMSAEHGGMGLSLLEFGLLSEVLGGSPVGHYVFNCQAPDAGNMELLTHFGDAYHAEHFTRPLLQGDVRSCFAMTEPEHAGSNPVWMSTVAHEEGDEWVVTGHKWFTTAADGAAFAIVMAVTQPDAPLHLRASQIVVPCDTEGFEIVRNISVMGEAGEDYASHAEVRLSACRVPRRNLLGGQGAGFAMAQARLGPGRIHHCMRWIGICERALDLMCRRVASRELSPGKMLGHKQMIQAWLAESRAEIDAARLMTLRCAWLMERDGVRGARQEVSTLKFYVAGVLQRVLDRAVQAHGALGMTDDTPLAYWYRHERAARIYDGPDEVHKLSVAKKMLQAYGSSAEE